MGKAALVSSLREFTGSVLRDIHLFTKDDHEVLYVRDDVATEADDADYIDNERYGYVTRSTYEGLHDATYEFTVRGFADFYLIRTFLGEEDTLGLLITIDRDEGPIDVGGLQDQLEEVIDEYGIEMLLPDADTD